MRPKKVMDNVILEGLTSVFRAKGFEGASLSELAEATGLKKASLYHRYPNGKNEMGAAVLHYLDAWVDQHVFQALVDTELSPKLRLKKAVAQIFSLYNGGDDSCIFRAMSMKNGIALFEEQINTGMQAWIEAFRQLGLAFGWAAEKSYQHALRTLIEIQGSLIVCKGLDDTSIFVQTLTDIEHRYLDG